MITVISPHQFKKVAWKNGKGFTSELAINDGGSLDEFEWRLSIAAVVEDGVFSSFPGIKRHLFLLDGNGIKLQHQQGSSEKVSTNLLSELLDLAVFSGEDETHAELLDGAISDFNLMVKEANWQVEVAAIKSFENKTYELSDINFLYTLEDECLVSFEQQELNMTLEAKHLLKIDTQGVSTVAVQGSKLIFIALKKL